MRIIASLLGACLLSILFVSSAAGQVQRTFVSGLGSDGNPCSRPAPCRTFTQAISQTNPGGEVIVLDSAGYGTFTIVQSVSIIAPPGVYAGISVFSGDGIDISFASDVVLRGLTISNQKGGLGSGINFSGPGGTLHVDGCAISGFSTAANAGIIFQPAAGKLEVKDSVFRNNLTGIEVHPVSGSALATIDHVRLEENVVGVAALDGSTVTVSNSVTSANTNGFGAAAMFRPAEINIEFCVVSNNAGSGVLVASSGTAVATARVSNTTVTHNGIGLNNDTGSPAVLLSRTNNTVEGNGTDTVGTIGSYLAK